MSTGAYAADKCLAHPESLRKLRAGEFPYPRHLHLIPSDYCNLSCPGCSYRAEGFRSTEMYRGPAGEKNPKRFLPWHVLQRVLDDCAEMGTKGIEVTGGGSPTLHPHIIQLLELAQLLGLQTALITNGLTLHRQDLLVAAAKGAWVRISIDAASSPTYDTVRPTIGRHGVPNATQNYPKVIGHLSRLRALRDELGTSCAIGAGFVVQRQNWKEIRKAAKAYRAAGADNVRFSGLFSPEGEAYFAGWREDAEALERETVAEFDSPSFRVHGRFCEKVADLHAAPDYKRCFFQNFTLYLGADANLYRCCVTSYQKHGLLGNIIEAGGLKKLLDRPETQASIRDFDARTCPACQFSDRNRAIAAAVAGDDVPAPLGLIHPWFV